MSLTNIYHLRRVSPAHAKPCFICYKPTSSVLITPDNRDFFYTCDGHLKDKGFASPIVDKEEEEKKKKEEMAKAIEEVKKEYEEKQRLKKEKKEEKEKAKDKAKDGDGKDESKEEKKEEKERDDKIKAIEAGETKSDTMVDEPRVFQLHKNIHQMRLSRLQNLAQAKRTADRLRTPGALPSVPTGDPSKPK